MRRRQGGNRGEGCARSAWPMTPSQRLMDGDRCVGHHRDTTDHTLAPPAASGHHSKEAPGLGQQQSGSRWTTGPGERQSCLLAPAALPRAAEAGRSQSSAEPSSCPRALGAQGLRTSSGEPPSNAAVIQVSEPCLWPVSDEEGGREQLSPRSPSSAVPPVAEG